ncbi:VanZ family protein [Paenibacillus sp. H1-7]|uniref:VanZ family protein n=1 Tax=Paenibacillus sp. H1-7 TaxID=2282849 RepID=UPI001EF7E011|nr:VanZ family protein [Paenibacillus sp. H1-7]
MKSLLRSKLLTRIAWVIFLSYGVFMVYLLFFGFSRSSRTERMYNLVPFKTIWSYIDHFRYFNFDIWIINLFGNVAAFVPFGFLIPWLFPFYARLSAIVKLFVAALLVVESMQFIFKVGSFDIDDILLNVLGGLLGFALYVGMIRCKTGSSRIH